MADNFGMGIAVGAANSRRNADNAYYSGKSVGYAEGKAHGIAEGKAAGHEQQAIYVARLLRHLKARARQKDALIGLLKKYEPNHPYLNQTPAKTEAAELMQVEKVEIKLLKSTDSDELSRYLTNEVGELMTEGDLAMEADNIVNIPTHQTPEEEDKKEKILHNYNPPPAEINRRLSVAEALVAAENERARLAAIDAKVAARKEAVKGAFTAVRNGFSKLFGG